MSISLFIAIYTDADLTKALAKELRRNGFDAIAAKELGYGKWSDEQHLEFAVSQGRAVVTKNRGDFLRLYDEYWQAGKIHYGTIITDEQRPGELLRRMLRLLDSVSAEEMMNNYKYLAEFK